MGDYTNTFEEMGPEKVRLLLSNNGFNHHVSQLAIDWLAAKDREERTRLLRVEANQAKEATSAKRAAWIAAWLALAATVIALLAWMLPIR